MEYRDSWLKLKLSSQKTYLPSQFSDNAHAITDNITAISGNIPAISDICNPCAQRIEIWL